LKQSTPLKILFAEKAALEAQDSKQ